MIRFETTIAALAIGMTISLASPATAENVLRFTSGSGGAVTMDPHSSGLLFDRAATMQVYEQLLDIDSNLAIVPQLAVGWQPLDPNTWEFELRQGVHFHDGTPLTPEDVVFSIERARAGTSQLQTPVANIAAIRAINNRILRITTTAPDPLLWMRLSFVAIMSKNWSETHDVPTPADRYGEETYASRHANGTGPFVLEEFEPHGRWVLIRNPDWWGKADNSVDIDRIVHTWSSDDEDNLAALLDGEVDLLQAPLYSGLAAIQRDPDLKIVYRPKLQTFFFGFDQGSTELRSSDVKGKNPFKDKRVRQAMAHAIDMATVLRPLMGKLFIPAGTLVPPGVNGYAPELAQPAPHDPDRARASDFFLDSWQSDPDSEGLLNYLFHSQSPHNMARYANPRVDELIEKIKTQMVTYARDAYLEEAWKILTDDLVYLPVRHGVSVFAMRTDLEVLPDPWDVPRFRLARLIIPSGK
jgi:peptide/nickel transport system substrate-binding protein